ncbi:hypothetical protein HID58_037595 [Brassica napus]|uniref:Uncharacterized protein n=1 Tax=Brassica napus TaxID=3708 RepID=A0ABQ8BN58_BRANA|nr:hypothetical protein HID58_037593 [Brassica napus]KAH0905768.1 hypothetical protein HID58_037595 [Brassica napus]
MDLLAQISGCYSRSTGTKLFFRGFRKDRSQTSLPNHIDPFCSLRAKYVSLDGFGLSPKTPLTVAHTNKCSPLLSFLDFTDQWLNFDFVKSSWLGSGTLMSIFVFLTACVMVRLGPEDTTRFIPVRLEAVKRSTSRCTVTIPHV